MIILTFVFFKHVFVQSNLFHRPWRDFAIFSPNFLSKSKWIFHWIDSSFITFYWWTRKGCELVFPNFSTNLQTKVFWVADSECEWRGWLVEIQLISMTMNFLTNFWISCSFFQITNFFLFSSKSTEFWQTNLIFDQPQAKYFHFISFYLYLFQKLQS